MNTTGAIILAAGGSRRLGRPKQWLRYRGQPLVRRAAEAARAAGVGPVLVVSGAEPTIAEALAGLEVETVINTDWELGVGTSIRCGMKALQNGWPECPRVILMTCDQPLVDPGVIGALMQIHDLSGKSIVACRYGGTVGVPCLFAARWFHELQELPAAAGAKQILTRQAGAVAEFNFPGGVCDIDTDADVAWLRSLEQRTDELILAHG